MSKPRTQEVDYFPHYCEHGKVLFILESNFQNDGYAVFYKIQELLAKTNGHCYDCSSVEGWEYLLSKMNIPEERVVSIIEKLVAMKTLDPGLWKHKRLWMQSFVDSIEDAYSRRKVNLPSKPDIPSISNPPSGTNVNILPTERDVSGTNVNIYPQSKVKESKVKNIIYRKQKTPIHPDFKISDKVKTWAIKKGHSRLEEHLESFVAKCNANGYQYVDWDAAFMEAIRGDWAKLKSAGGNGNGRTTTNFSDKRESVQTKIDADLAKANALYAAAKAAASYHSRGDAGDDNGEAIPTG